MFADKFENRGITTALEFCTQLLDDTGVALLPGSSFSRPEAEFSARLAYVDFDGARALAAVKTIPLHKPLPDDFINVYCAKVLEGVDALTEWVNR